MDFLVELESGAAVDHGQAGYAYVKGSLATDTAGYVEKNVYSAGSYGCRITGSGAGMITGNGTGVDDNPISYGGWFMLRDKASNYIEHFVATAFNVGAPYGAAVFGSANFGLSEVNSSLRIQKQLSGWLSSYVVDTAFHFGVSYDGSRTLAGLNGYLDGQLVTPTATADTVDGFPATLYHLNIIGQYARSRANSFFYTNKKALTPSEMHALMIATRGFS